MPVNISVIKKMTLLKCQVSIIIIFFFEIQ